MAEIADIIREHATEKGQKHKAEQQVAPDGGPEFSGEDQQERNQEIKMFLDRERPARNADGTRPIVGEEEGIGNEIHHAEVPAPAKFRPAKPDDAEREDHGEISGEDAEKSPQVERAEAEPVFGDGAEHGPADEETAEHEEQVDANPDVVQRSDL